MTARSAIVLAIGLTCLSTTACRRGFVTACGADQTRVDGECVDLCIANHECGRSECCNQGTCLANDAGCFITEILGSGPADARADTGDYHICDSLILHGQGLANPNRVDLVSADAANATPIEVAVVPGSTDDSLEVVLPDDVEPGRYTLMVMNQGATCEATATILAGEDGADGADGNDGVDGMDGAVGPTGPMGPPGMSTDTLENLSCGNNSAAVFDGSDWGCMLRAAGEARYVVATDGTTYEARGSDPGSAEYTGTDASTVIQNLIDGISGPATIIFREGTYDLTSTVNIKSDLNLEGYGATISITNGYPMYGTGVRNVRVAGFVFDLNGTAQQVALVGDDAAPVENIVVEDCSFLNPSSGWSLQIGYLFPAAPAMPTGFNNNIRVLNNLFDSATATGSLEVLIYVNVHNATIAGNVFRNTPTGKGGALAIYGYCKDVHVNNNKFIATSAKADAYISQSRRVLFYGNVSEHRVTLFDSRQVSISHNILAQVRIIDFDLDTFDTNASLFRGSQYVTISDNQFDNEIDSRSAIDVNMQGNLTNLPRDIVITGNTSRGDGPFAVFKLMPDNVATWLERVTIADNTVFETDQFMAATVGLVRFESNSTAMNDDGLRDVVVAGNHFATSKRSSKPWDVSVATTGASNVVITGNVMRNAGIDNPGPYTVANNTGFATTSRGSTAIVSGTTSVVVNHNLSVTPSIEDFALMAANLPTQSVGLVWVDAITATDFAINVENDPGTSGITFGWRVDVR